MDNWTFLEWMWGGNTARHYLSALLTWLAIWVCAKPLVKVLLIKVEKAAMASQSEFGDFLLSCIKEIPNWVYFVAGVTVALQWLYLPPPVFKIAQLIFVLALTVAAIGLAQHVAAYALGQYHRNKAVEDSTARTATQGVLALIKVVLWICGLLFLLDNMGVNITTLVAGLGIGGIAVAMASQTILGDLFSSFTIYLDKPFGVGDLITVGELTGRVEHIGIKTTRVRSLSGEQLVFPNSDLTKSRIQNFQQMNERRVLFVVGVTYDTPSDKLKKIPEVIRAMFKDIDQARVDRVHFQSFGDSSLNYEIVYFVKSRDYTTYMDVQQKVNFELKDKMESMGVEFAYPTQTVHVVKEN